MPIGFGGGEKAAEGDQQVVGRLRACRRRLIGDSLRNVGVLNLVEAIRESTQESTNQAGQRIVEKDLNIQPTITVRPGWPLNVVVHKDLVFLKPYREQPP